jgi:CheY-like chemotaxis protein
MQVVMEAHKHQPAAIVLDVMMPGGGGLGAIRTLKATTSTTLIPVIAISGSTDPALPAQVVAEGASAFLPKPVHLPISSTRLREWPEAGRRR